MKIAYTDVLVIGGGLAGQRAAIAARRRGHDVRILSLVPAKRSHSVAAQGGMQASLGNSIKGLVVLRYQHSLISEPGVEFDARARTSRTSGIFPGNQERVKSHERETPFDLDNLSFEK